MQINVIGGGLAGSEAAWQLAKRGVKVTLFEMRPRTRTPAHKTSNLGELVCSNSLKAVDPLNAHGLLKKEMTLLGSLILEAAEQSRLPGGKALVVDRDKFAEYITQRISQHPNIKVVRKEITKIPVNKIVIIATGPLTSDSLTEDLKKLHKNK